MHCALYVPAGMPDEPKPALAWLLLEMPAEQSMLPPAAGEHIESYYSRRYGPDQAAALRQRLHDSGAPRLGGCSPPSEGSRAGTGRGGVLGLHAAAGCSPLIGHPRPPPAAAPAGKWDGAPFADWRWRPST